MTGISDPLIFDELNVEQTAELLRQTLSLLNEKRLPATPVNYDLFYIYFAGKNKLLNEKLDALMSEENEWDATEARKLFKRFLMECGETVVEEVREELIRTVSYLLETLADILGKTATSNERLQQDIDKLAASTSPNEILSAASLILKDTRDFVTESRSFESQMNSYSAEVKKLKAELNQIKETALLDSLTSISNRRAFDLELEKLINDRRQGNSIFSLILADLDHFKHFNDTYGHLIGDKVLRAFARVLKQITRKSDFPARFGGEEFAILLPRTTIDDAYRVAENIRKAVGDLRLKNTKTGERLDEITISLGVATYKNGDSALQVIDRCDEALYRAKKEGRNRSIAAD